MTDEDPFRCPRCGSRDVRVSGDGSKTCTSCPWSYQPAETRDQATIEDY